MLGLGTHRSPEVAMFIYGHRRIQGTNLGAKQLAGLRLLGKDFWNPDIDLMNISHLSNRKPSDNTHTW